jgi:hypothetical protein
VVAFDLVIEILEDPDDARGLRGRPVTRDGHEVEAQGQADVPRQIGEEERCALEHPHEDGFQAVVVPGDRSPELRDLGLDVLGGDDDLGQLAPVGSGHVEQAV